jgi:hypothetical protein
MAIAAGPFAALGLAAASTATSPAGLEADEWDALLARLTDEHLAGIVLDGADRGLVSLRDDQHEALLAVHEAAMVATLRLESFLLVVRNLLGERGLDMRVLKGPSCAHLDYEQPELRAFTDIDVLVRGEQFDAVAACLSAAGMQRRFDEPRPGFTARFGKGVCFTGANGLELDVHRALTAGPFGLGDASALWRRSDSFVLAGSSVECLAREERAVAAAVHACLGSTAPRLVPLRDVAQILSQEVDIDRVISVSDELGVRSVLARAILLARATLALDAPLAGEAWALGYRPTRRERQLLHAYITDDRSYAGQMLAGARAVKGLGARVEYVRALALPNRDYLDDREHRYGTRARRAARLITGRSRGAQRRQDGTP